MSIKVTIVRHGQTGGNARSEVNSKTEEELNETGWEQGILLGKYFKKSSMETFTKVYTSDMTRAVQTAKAIMSELGNKEIVPTEELRERNYGDWEDKTIRDLFKMAKESELHPVEVVAKGGETNEQAFQRLITFLKSLLDADEENEEQIVMRKNPPKHYLLVSHSAIIFGFLHKLLMCPGEEFHLDNLKGEKVFYPVINTSFTSFLMSSQKGEGGGKLCFEFEHILCADHLPEKFQEIKKRIVYTNEKQCKVFY